MRLLVLGGTVFLSRAVAADALARGHEVVCVARGTSGSVPEGVTLVEADRTAGPLLAVSDLGAFDAVADVARHPSWVRHALDTTPGAHWVFVSTVNVYADDATPGGRPGVTPLVEPRDEDVDLSVDPEAYGPMKRACEGSWRPAAARSSAPASSSAPATRPGASPTGRTASPRVARCSPPATRATSSR